MDVRVAILGGTFLLLVAAIVAFVVAVVKAARASKFESTPTQFPSADYSLITTSPINPATSAFEVGSGREDLSEALLAPMRTEPWVPPTEPASTEQLQDVSLEERIARFQPAPDIPEPAFTVDTYEDWKVAAPTQPLPVVPEVMPASAPEVVPVAPEPPFTPIPESPAAEMDEDAVFDAEIAALMPSEPAPVVVPEPEPVVVPVPEPEPAPVVVPEPAPVVVPEPEPAPAPEPEPEPEPVVMPAPAVAEQHDDGFWQSMMREEQGLPSMVPSTIPAAPLRVEAPAPLPPLPPRPAAVVHSEPAPQPVVVEEPRTLRPPRPAVRVAGAYVETESLEAEPHVTPAEASARDSAPEVHMAAPVEMWFGPDRVGVKAGTRTYDQFMKYAGVLLGDLQESKAARR